MIELDETHLIGKGNSRSVYLHPEDPNRVIKIEGNQASKAKPNNAIDYLYFNYLLKRKRDLSQIATCYGWIDTTLGEGLMFQNIRNFDGTKALTFKEAILSGSLSHKVSQNLLEDFIRYLYVNNIIFADIALSNLMVQFQYNKIVKLIVIDGLGTRRFKFKFWIYRKFDYMAYRKIIKQTNKLRRSYDNLLLKCKLIEQ